MRKHFSFIKTALPGPKAKRIIQRDVKYASPSYIKEYPLVVHHGEGAYVEDVDGNRFLDFMAGIAVNITGYSHPVVLSAIHKQSEQFLHICGTDFYYESFTNLIERLAKMTAISGPKKVFLTNSGAEAVEAAIKLVRYHTRRPYLIAFHGSFHGRTLGALGLTASKNAQRAHFAPLLPGVHHIPYGYCYHCPYNLKYKTCDIYCAKMIERVLCKSFMKPEEIAAIFVEPIQGEGGYVVPPAEFLQELREFATEHGILLVADEVQAGMGRTGKFLSIEHFGVEPDVVTLAKGLASGLPLGAMIAKAPIMTWAAGSHGSTFGGNPVACAASLATLGLLEAGLMDNAAKMGKVLQTKLHTLKNQFPMIGDVRGKGLMIGVEIVKNKKSREPDGKRTHDIVQKAFRKGLLLLSCGENTLRISPPLIIGLPEIDIAIDILRDTLKTV